ncbi:MAG: dTMP kinase [Bryobacteraceae bacterium]|nr:dTMP kinase [Bryobacteraceae bacterium]MDW8378355.1 dTMP kinase [Bryobacterales bacterium]
MTKGLFVSFEGVEGSGKSTQMRRLANRLRQMGFRVVENIEPGGTRIGKQIRSILLEAAHQELSATAELLLFFASRAQAVDELILPALAQGQIVLSDRFTDSTIAYQGGGRQLGWDVVLTLDRVACRGLKPSLTLCLDLDVEIGLQRARRRNAEEGQSETRLDDESLSFHRRVRAAYHRLVELEPERVKLVDASRPLEEVEETVWRLVEQQLAGIQAGGC